jgi:hypothetical protein
MQEPCLQINPLPQSFPSWQILSMQKDIPSIFLCTQLTCDSRDLQTKVKQKQVCLKYLT